MMFNDQKEILVQHIEEEDTWLFARVIEKIANLHLSESMWELVTSDKTYPRAYPAFGQMGKAFAYLSDSCTGTYLITKCGYGERADRDNMRTCFDTINEWGDKYSFTLDAINIEGSEEAYKMILGYVATLAMYLNDGANYFWKNGQKPASDKVHIIVKVDDSIKDVSIQWSEDKTTLNYYAPAKIKLDHWKEKMELGLRRGWTIM